ILADPLSQLRSGTHNKNTIFTHYDAFLKDEQIRSILKPDCIIRFGAMPVSKSLMFYLKENHNIPQYVIDSGRGWRDPVGSASEFIYCHEEIFCVKLIDALQNKERKNEEWIRKWKQINDLATVHFSKLTSLDLNEVNFIHHLQTHLP